MSSTLVIPIFPLGLVAFPGEQVNLHIFEPRYRQLFQDCEVSDLTFGIVPYINGSISNIGTEMRLDRIVNRYDDGKMDVSTEGIRTFDLIDYKPEYPNKMYPGAEVSWRISIDDPDITSAIQIVDFLAQLYEHMQIDNVPVGSPSTFRVVDVIHKIGLTTDQELLVLQMPSESSRQIFILEHLQRFVPQVIEMEELRRKAALNGHFKNIIPPEV